MQICQEATEEWFWMEYCLEKHISFQYARWMWDHIHMDIVTIRSNDGIEGQICEPLATYRWNYLQHPVLSVIGKAGCGKTTWAKLSAPKPALFVSHIDQLRLFKPGFHKVIYYLHVLH